MDNQESKKKYENYVTQMTSYVTAKYFPDKTLYGGIIYDVKVNTYGQTVKASRLPPHQSYADPASFDDLQNSVANSEEETSADALNRKYSGKNWWNSYIIKDTMEWNLLSKKENLCYYARNLK